MTVSYTGPEWILWLLALVLGLQVLNSITELIVAWYTAKLAKRKSWPM